MARTHSVSPTWAFNSLPASSPWMMRSAVSSYTHTVGEPPPVVSGSIPTNSRAMLPSRFKVVAACCVVTVPGRRVRVKVARRSRRQSGLLMKRGSLLATSWSHNL